MSTSLRRLRQGLPRVPGGEPWPPPGFVEVEDRPDYLAETSAGIPVTASMPQPAAPPPADGVVRATAESEPTAVGVAVAVAAPAIEERRVPLRRGLPRTAGGEPWPPAGFGVQTVSVDEFGLAPTAEAVPVQAAQAAVAPPTTGPAAAGPTADAVPRKLLRVPLRRGLPRTAGGEPWPPAGFGALSVAAVDDSVGASETVSTPATDDRTETEPSIPDEAPATTTRPVLTAPARTAPARTAPARTAPVRPPAARTATARTATGTPAAPGSTDPAALLAKIVQTVRFPALALVGAIAVVGGLFMFVRWLMGTDAMVEFLARYPGEYPLPESAEPGFPAWVRWSHFLNMFFIILIIRSGLQSRYEKKPPAYWTPRWSGFGGGKKISISLWLHQMLDILWLLNGIVFITLLFVTGHWMRIVPTSWTVFPNALSALLQYLSLDWPTDNGWVNYNSLQQLAYFTIVFIAAPLAAVTGLRMSGLWPSKAQRLSTVYPVELARALHFPTMLFFVIFVIMHVAMVFATGALKNLNHMFAGTDSTNWAGFWILVGALTVIAVVWELARPMILAPIANLLGQVSQR